MQRFFDDDGMNFATLVALGSAYRGAADVGEVLATIERIDDGDRAGWVNEWRASADTLFSAARTSERQGHEVSARTAYLRASLYFDHASSMSTDHEGAGQNSFHGLWERHRDAWDRAAALFRPPIRKVAIPYEGTELEGYIFKPDDSDEPRPFVILNNGSDGPVTSMWCQGAAACLDRGWGALTFDGPGQGSTFHRQGLGFRHDWEAVIGPVVDWLGNRPDVDVDRIALHGVSQAGYWVPRAAAYEKRIVAAVADPGVVDVSSSWLEHLPDEMRELLDSGDKESFDTFMEAGLEGDPEARATLRWRMAPYGTTSYFEAYSSAMEMRLDEDTILAIDCPVLITDPDDEQFWPGQSRELFEKLTGPKEIIPFSRHEGANWHCEVAAQGLRDERVFDWLERIFSSR